MARTKELIEAEIAEYTELLNDADIPSDVKVTAKEELASLEEELKQVTQAGSSSEAPDKKKTPAIKAAPQRDPRGRKKYTPEEKKAAKKAAADKKKGEKLYFIASDGKKVAITEADCWETMKALEARLSQHKASQGKYKTKPITQKVGDNLQQAAKQATDAVSETRAKNEPEKVIEGAQEVIKCFDALFAAIEKMSGKKIPAETKKEVKGLFKDFIGEVKENM